MRTLVRWTKQTLWIATLTSAASQTIAGETNLFGAHMMQPDVSVASETNGVIELTCKVGFLGGCCFPLTSHDVTASIDVPAGLTVLAGPEPLNYASIEAPVSGTPQAWGLFRWRVQRTGPDTGSPLSVTVSSPDSGQVKTTFVPGQHSRIRVQGPRLPDVLTAGRELALVVDAECLDQDRFVKGVHFWYSAGIPPEAEAIAVSQDPAERGLIRFTVAGKTLAVQGKGVALARKYEPAVWRGTLPSDIQGPLCGVAVAMDDLGRSAPGPVVRLEAPLTFSAKIGALWRRISSGDKPEVAGGYPADSSTVAYLFLDRGDASRRLAEQMETYRRAVPHRLHVVTFVEGVTPGPLLDAYRSRHQVVRFPSVVYDGHAVVDGTHAVAVAGTLDHCFRKPSPRLSMELHGGVMAGRLLSLGFIMCNHAARREARGHVTTFAFENGVMMDGWRCDRVVRSVMLEGRTYSIPVGKCQPPAMMKWEIPGVVAPGRTGGLTVILDEQGRLIDSICTERPCSRTGICG